MAAMTTFPGTYKRIALVVSHSSALLTVTLNRPSAGNAFDYHLIADLTLLVYQLSLPECAVRVVILAANGRNFSVGVDLKSALGGLKSADDDVNERWDWGSIDSQRAFSRVMTGIRGARQVFIACVQGAASGGGFALALSCDLRIATPESKFNASFIQVGLTNTDLGVSFFLPRLLSSSLSRLLLFTGDTLTGPALLSSGLVTSLVPQSELLSTAIAHAEKMLTFSPKGLAMTKEQVNAVDDGMSLSQAVISEDARQVYLNLDPESKAYGARRIKQLFKGKL